MQSVQKPRVGPPLARHPKGRVCAIGGCNTRLSSYNPSRFCYFHDQQVEALPPRRSWDRT